MLQYTFWLRWWRIFFLHSTFKKRKAVSTDLVTQSWNAHTQECLLAYHFKWLHEDVNLCIKSGWNCMNKLPLQVLCESRIILRFMVSSQDHNWYVFFDALSHGPEKIKSKSHTSDVKSSIVVLQDKNLQRCSYSRHRFGLKVDVYCIETKENDIYYSKLGRRECGA